MAWAINDKDMIIGGSKIVVLGIDVKGVTSRDYVAAHFNIRVVVEKD